VATAFTLLLGALALAAGLAFGLGNRELAGEYTRRWVEKGARRVDEMKRAAEAGARPIPVGSGASAPKPPGRI